MSTYTFKNIRRNVMTAIMTGFLSLCTVPVMAQAVTLHFQLFITIDDFGMHRGPNKPHLPSYSPNVTLEGHTLHFYYNHPDCTVQLLDDDEVVFEEPFFPYTANNINLPAALLGQYQDIIDSGRGCRYYRNHFVRQWQVYPHIDGHACGTWTD